MRILISHSLNPCFNLATEEYLLKNSTENILLLYRNQPCVVVGKHQNALGEINYRFVHENNIPVIRRISGGGTVYHDQGNINFTFLQNGEEGNLVNFRQFISPVAAFLESLGIPAEIGPRNDILVNGLKVSGNAEHIFRKRTLHHGTLLFSSALSNLRNALHVEPGKYTDRAVKSVRSKVANIKESSDMRMDVTDFLGKLAENLSGFYNARQLTLNSQAISEITQAAQTKYTDWAWCYGYSPAYSFKNLYTSGNINYSITLEVEKGTIQKAGLSGNLNPLGDMLVGKKHTFGDISEIIESFEGQQQHTYNPKELAWAFF